MEDSNRTFVLPDEDSGYIFRIDDASDPAPSPFKNYDEKGNEKPPKYQTTIKATIVDCDNPKFIGQQVQDYFGISLHTKAKFYKLARAVFGGELDPRWQPNKQDLIGKYFKASVVHKDANDQGQVYPKMDGFLPFRGNAAQYDHVSAASSADEDGDNTEDVPF